MSRSNHHPPAIVGPTGMDENAWSPATMVISSRSSLLEAGLLTLLPEVPQLRHIASTNDAPGTVHLLLQHKPDVLLLDHDLAADVHGHAVVKGADFSGHSPRVLLLSTRHHVGMQSGCGERCACGFVRDRSPLRHIRSAMRIIGGCGASRLGDGYCSSCPLRQSVRLPKLPLSEREYQVFDHIGREHGNLQMSRELGLSVKTIESHRESIKQKLGLGSAGALREAAMAWHRGDYVLKPDSITRSAQGNATPASAKPRR